MMEIVTLVLAGLACVLSLANLLRRPRGLSGEDLEKVRQDLLAEIRQTRQELSGSVAAGLQASNVQTEQKLESIRTTMEVRLNAMQAVTDRRLGEMRQTVDEKLQKTLEDRLQKSFGLVSQQLELVYKGLGEMRTLAAGVGDLKKVLSNVKTRGILGEVQLGAILEQLLAPGQYAENVATVPGSTERVEFAVRLPGDADGPVWLPIDAKFPQDAYAALLAAYDTADKTAVELAAKELDKRVRGFGKDIHDKYLAPGHTTDFGVMFLPVEGLYAEVVRRGTAERLQREYKIVVAGPTTMAALLNSLQMGFKTLAIQKRSSEVWKVLGSVKAEFDTFGQALAQAQNRLNQASSELENLVGVRTRQIQRKLQQVTLLPGEESGEEKPVE
ncbi:MAG TPA: DNA recombination protein RmuC [Candidatus Fournierella pullicola]|uniref:DNA recombination protein RmuC n=1 Tax=Candidatus Allofournierella pullicola TaxID=2838596 RepID=A0A9D1V487_9FIRM|nr:DNA recombination protein RmuC [Candidatus Fournierella pullicola]